MRVGGGGAVVGVGVWVCGAGVWVCGVGVGRWGYAGMVTFSPLASAASSLAMAAICRSRRFIW